MRDQSFRSTLGLTLLGLLVWGSGCAPLNPQVNRGTMDGVPWLGSCPDCPAESDRATAEAVGQVDLRRYGPRPVSGDPMADQLVPWREGIDCDGKETRWERLVGRRRLGHTVPFLGWWGIGRYSEPGQYSSPRGPEWDCAIQQNACLYLCLKDNDEIDGIQIRDDDILAYDGQHFSKLIDGGDVGMSRLEIDSLASVGPNQLLISFRGDFEVDQEHPLPGISGLVRDADILLFQWTQAGEITRGQFQRYFDGSDVGLDEEIRLTGLERLPNGDLVMQLEGEPQLNGTTVRRGDWVVFRPKQLGDHTDGTWKPFLDRKNTPWNDRVAALAIYGSECWVSLSQQQMLNGVLVQPSEILGTQTQQGDEAASNPSGSEEQETPRIEKMVWQGNKLWEAMPTRQADGVWRPTADNTVSAMTIPIMYLPADQTEN